MKNVKVVIGSGFGDEGKGIITDTLSEDWANLVVRFNGGAQAAHTVEKKDGRRHVFGHFGSGTFNNINTYLSKYFVVNPILFAKEHKVLSNVCSVPTTYMHEDCFISTIFDMFVNKTIEKWRGQERHGSCGIGFNETITRHLDNDYNYKITVKDLFRMPGEFNTLYWIWHSYIPQRLINLGMPADLAKEAMDSVDFEAMYKGQMESVEYMANHIHVTNDDVLNVVDNVVFEGAQGLLLDEFHKWFPHVTRSRTGIKNVVSIIKERTDVQTVELYYVMRSYMTRHGAGPFPTEHDLPIDIVDKTNVPNEHQGSLRFGYLDLDLLRSTITLDGVNDYRMHIEPKVNIALTCVDQIGDYAYFVENDELHKVKKDKFPKMIRQYFSLPLLVNSSPITAEKVYTLK